MEEEKLYECEICNKKYPKKEYLYSKYENKCILHCEKDDWYDIEYDLKNWSMSKNKIKYFWKKIRNLISSVSDKEKEILDFKNIIFPQFEYIHYLDNKIIAFNHELGNKEFNFVKYELEGLASYSRQPEFIIDVNIDFSNSTFLDDVNFNYYKFKKFTCFNNVKFHGKCSFKYAEFNEVLFNDVDFYKEVIFKNSILNFRNYHPDEDFKNTIFHDNVSFYISKFSTVESKKAYDIKFMGTQFKRIYIMGCDFEKGICFFRDTKADIIAINSATINFLYIESDVPNIHISNNKKEINKLTIKHNTLKSLTIHNTIIKEDFLLNKEQYQKRDIFDLDLLNLKESTFEGKVKIQFYDIQDASFYNTKFQDLADFYRTKFYKVNFERTDFKNIAVFSEAEFSYDVDFKYTKFLSTSIFRDTVITGKLNLRDTIFKEDANFLDITSKSRKIHDKEKKDFIHIGELEDIKVANRETARIIKNFFDSSNNIIEANRFYKLEMKQREKELDFKKSFLEWIIFKIHSISSNHSQDWLIAIFWIISITFLYSYSNFLLNKDKIELVLFPFIISSLIIFINILEVSIYNQIKNIYKITSVGLLYFIYGFITSAFYLINFSNNINPFSIIIDGNDDNKIAKQIDFLTLIYKIVIAYLIYQLIVSVRQNTRRK